MKVLNVEKNKNFETKDFSVYEKINKKIGRVVYKKTAKKENLVKEDLTSEKIEAKKTLEKKPTKK